MFLHNEEIVVVKSEMLSFVIKLDELDALQLNFYSARCKTMF